MKILKAAALFSLVAAECSWTEHNKPKRCVDIAFNMRKTNSWVCRDCFNYRVEFNYQETAWWWTNEDFIYLTFDEPVSFVTVAHPIKDVVLYSTSPAGQQTYKLDFKPDFNPGDNRIDFNIQFREDDLTSVVSAATVCPFCHPVPSFADNLNREGLLAQFLNWRDIDIELSHEQKNFINYRQYRNKMNRVYNQYLTLTNNIVVDATYSCDLPYNADKFVSESFSQWLIEKSSQINSLQQGTSGLAGMCRLVDLIEEGVQTLADTYVCLDDMPPRKQRRISEKIEKISNSKGPRCQELNLG